MTIFDNFLVILQILLDHNNVDILAWVQYSMMLAVTTNGKATGGVI